MVFLQSSKKNVIIPKITIDCENYQFYFYIASPFLNNELRDRSAQLEFCCVLVSTMKRVVDE